MSRAGHFHPTQGGVADAGGGDSVAGGEDTSDELVHEVGVEGLSEHSVGPAAFEKVHISLHGVAGHADDKGGAALLPQQPRGAGPVEHRHLVVHQDGLGGSALCAHMGVLLQRVLPVTCLLTNVPLDSEDAHQQLAVGHGVIHHQHMPPHLEGGDGNTQAVCSTQAKAGWGGGRGGRGRVWGGGGKSAKGSGPGVNSARGVCGGIGGGV
eukprot:CAMPEP_0173221164 /NCGR_PEP_ID=MMETSP1142-20121109/2570_1 /TAXON_ID=483371 /ORGANISM="non described non described, Strain CCMP2298" /LENGTH=208 /DNA_ID=CAMNT_0014149167 /DNA_START=204 /DNA_END=830 /DNA_ORIENTATION=-